MLIAEFDDYVDLSRMNHDDFLTFLASMNFTIHRRAGRIKTSFAYLFNKSRRFYLISDIGFQHNKLKYFYKDVHLQIVNYIQGIWDIVYESSDEFIGCQFLTSRAIGTPHLFPLVNIPHSYISLPQPYVEPGFIWTNLTGDRLLTIFYNWGYRINYKTGKTNLSTATFPDKSIRIYSISDTDFRFKSKKYLISNISILFNATIGPNNRQTFSILNKVTTSFI
jgi:hypothetical protein